MSEVPLYFLVWRANATISLEEHYLCLTRVDRRISSSPCTPVNYFTEMCSGSEEGSYLRLIDFCI